MDLTFYYGMSGILGFNYDGRDYFYFKNLQGDVYEIYEAQYYEPMCVAKYVYDAWGKIVSITDGNGNDVSNDPTHIANINPIRYRSYYYDRETNLYYLESRYYDPETGRFLNADNIKNLQSKTIQGANLYAYCLNNPVIYADEKGKICNILIGAIVGAVVGAFISAASQIVDEMKEEEVEEESESEEEKNLFKTGEFWAKVVVAAGIGAVTGGFAASGVGLVGQVLLNSASGAGSSMIELAIDGEKNWENYVMRGAEGATIGAISGRIGGPGTASKHVTNSFKRVLKNGNFSYYFSQIKYQAYLDGKKAIPSIFKAALPSGTKIAIKALI
ncbi:MAG: RHS repeat-associated core domain-containing protein [Clostridia bacterium]|nr:RHS repeat-associated core domain-containing protein [Clostridia bacterium]